MRRNLVFLALASLLLLAVLTPASAGQQNNNSNSNSVPTGAVMFFDLDACPKGWDGFAGAHGRSVVGGTPGTSVGQALSTGENRTHQHVWSNLTKEAVNTEWSSYSASGTQISMIRWGDGIGNAGSGFYPLGLWGPGGDWTFHTDTSATADAMPYLQLLPCIKR